MHHAQHTTPQAKQIYTRSIVEYYAPHITILSAPIPDANAQASSSDPIGARRQA